MTSNEQIRLARVAFDAYCQAVQFKNHQGNAVPPWENLGSQIQSAWIAAADAIVEDLIGFVTAD